MSVDDQVRAAYERWDAGDVDGLLELFHEDAMFLVPGRTRLSGDHDKGSFRRVLEEVGAATEAGRHRREPVCSYERADGAVWLFHNHVEVDGQAAEYHSLHEWGLRDGRPHVWMLYVHEYDVFERAWR